MSKQVKFQNPLCDMPIITKRPEGIDLEKYHEYLNYQKRKIRRYLSPTPCKAVAKVLNKIINLHSDNHKSHHNNRKLTKGRKVFRKNNPPK